MTRRPTRTRTIVSTSAVKPFFNPSPTRGDLVWVAIEDVLRVSDRVAELLAVMRMVVVSGQREGDSTGEPCCTLRGTGRDGADGRASVGTDCGDGDDGYDREGT